MNVKLYKNTAPPNKVNKKNNLQGEITIENVRFVDNDSLDILKPIVLIDPANVQGLSVDIETIIGYNYLYIPKFNRFYFITDIVTIGALIKIETKVDVLYSHKSDILNSKQYILRNASRNNSPYLEDTMLPIRSDHNYIMKPFGDDVDDRTCGRVILATTGKGGTIV